MDFALLHPEGLRLDTPLPEILIEHAVDKHPLHRTKIYQCLGQLACQLPPQRAKQAVAIFNWGLQHERHLNPVCALLCLAANLHSAGFLDDDQASQAIDAFDHYPLAPIRRLRHELAKRINNIEVYKREPMLLPPGPFPCQIRTEVELEYSFSDSNTQTTSQKKHTEFSIHKRKAVLTAASRPIPQKELIDLCAQTLLEPSRRRFDRAAYTFDTKNQALNNLYLFWQFGIESWYVKNAIPQQLDTTFYPYSLDLLDRALHGQNNTDPEPSLYAHSENDQQSESAQGFCFQPQTVLNPYLRGTIAFFIASQNYLIIDFIYALLDHETTSTLYRLTVLNTFLLLYALIWVASKRNLFWFDQRGLWKLPPLRKSTFTPWSRILSTPSKSLHHVRYLLGLTDREISPQTHPSYESFVQLLLAGESPRTASQKAGNQSYPPLVLLRKMVITLLGCSLSLLLLLAWIG